MKNNEHVIKWATDYLISQGYSLQHFPEIIQETPWSKVIRFSTLKEDFFLKQTPPLLFLEAKILQFLANQLHANVPIVVAINDDQHSFLMQNAGISLRKYLKTDFQPELLQQAIKQFTTIQRLSEKHIESFFALGVPDWRLEKFHHLYNELINQKKFLKENGLTDKELKILDALSPKVSEQCKLLAQYPIPETLVQPDFHTNNVLFDPITKKMTFIDLGEIVIAHPFFSLLNFIHQTTTHEGVKEQDETYRQLQNTCIENWLDLATKNQLLDMFTLVNKLWPIYSALAGYRLMKSVDLAYLNSYYSDRPNQLAQHLRDYAASA